jgi:hypothetical protein
VIGSAASELRRRLGPLAWVVLEMAVSESCDGAASRLTTGRYRLLVAADVLSIIEVRPIEVAPAAVRPTVSQLSLLELGGRAMVDLPLRSHERVHVLASSMRVAPPRAPSC